MNARHSNKSSAILRYTNSVEAVKSLNMQPSLTFVRVCDVNTVRNALELVNFVNNVEISACTLWSYVFEIRFH